MSKQGLKTDYIRALRCLDYMHRVNLLIIY